MLTLYPSKIIIATHLIDGKCSKVNLLVLSLYKENYLHILNVCPFDYMAVAVSGKVERSLTGLTTPVG